MLLTSFVCVIAGPRLPPPVRSRAAAIASIPANVQSRIPSVMATLRGAGEGIIARVSSLFSEAEPSAPPPPKSSPRSSPTSAEIRHRRVASRGGNVAFTAFASSPSDDSLNINNVERESKQPIDSQLPLSSSRPLPPASPSVTAAVAYASTTRVGSDGHIHGTIHGKGRLPIVHAQPIWASPPPSSHQSPPTVAAVAVASSSSRAANGHSHNGIVIEEVADTMDHLSLAS